MLNQILPLTVAAVMSLPCLGLAGEPYKLDWSVQYGGEFDDTAEGVAIGRFGNIYGAGHERVREQGLDSVLQVVTPDGELSWDSKVPGKLSDLYLDVATDHRGGVFVVGRLCKSDRSDSQSAVLTKHYALNLHCWTRTIKASEYTSAEAVTTDACGNVFICGAARGKLGDRPIPHGSAGFVAKYDAFGRQCWLEFVRFPAKAVAQTLTVAADGTIYVGGYVGSVAHVAKLDCNGKTLRTGRIKLIELVARGNFRIRMHPDGHLICGGSSTSGRDIDGYLVGINRDDLSVLWDEPFRTAERDYVIDFCFDAAGVIHVAGDTSGALGKQLGKSDGFLARVSSSGEIIGKIYQFGTPEDDAIRGIAIDGCNRLIIGGRTRGTFPQATRMSGEKTHAVRPFSDAIVARFRLQ